MLDLGLFEVEKTRFTRVFGAFPPHKHNTDEVKKVQTHTRPLEIFRDLQRLAPIMGEAVDDANSVALAMERTMAFLEKSDHVLWHDKGDPFKHHKEYPQNPHNFTFLVDVIVGSYCLSTTSEMQQLELQLTGELPNHGAVSDANERRNHVWAANRETFAAFISMWLFALELRKSVTTQFAAAIRPLQYISDVGMGYPKEIVNPRSPYLRILGSEYIYEERLSPIALMRWIPGRIMKVTPMDLSRKPLNAPRIGGMGSVEPDNPWVTWGTKNASMFA